SLSNAEQVHPEMQKALRDTFPVEFDFSRPDRMMAEFAQNNHMLHLELMPAFLEYHLKTGVYLHGFGATHGGHWNESGHCLAARNIAAYLREQKLIPSGNSGQGGQPLPGYTQPKC